jgi:hypothetical protein
MIFSQEFLRIMKPWRQVLLMGNFFILTKNRTPIGRVASNDMFGSPSHTRSSFYGSKKKRSAFHIDRRQSDEVSPNNRMSDRVFSKFADFAGLKDESKIFGGLGAESKNEHSPMDPTYDSPSDNDYGSNSLRRNSSLDMSKDCLESPGKAPVKVEQLSLPGLKHRGTFFESKLKN